MAGDKGKKSTQRHEVPDAREMKSSEQKRQPRKLGRLIKHDPSCGREHAEQDRGGISKLLERVISFFNLRLGAEQEVMPGHRPYAFDVAWRKEDLPKVTAEKLINDVHHTSRDEDPHEGEMPLERAA